MISERTGTIEHQDAGRCSEPSASDMANIHALLLNGIKASVLGIALFDPDDNCVFRSPAFDALLDVQPGPQTYDSMIRHCHRTGRGLSIPDADVETWLARALLKRRRQPVRQYEKDLADGRWLRISETAFNHGWVLQTLDDITDLKSNEATLRAARDAALAAAETDDLTRLANRAAIVDSLDEAVGQARHAATSLSLALIDLDHFKRINDGYGHLAGDRVLVDFAEVGRAALRASDMLGRVGGEEFVIIMPKTLKPEAFGAVDRLRLSISRSRPLSPDFTYTMSAGVSALIDGETPNDFYKRVDTLLYRAKQSGRDRVICD